ncbi:hypothetical protein GB937_010176 [Aspergillus fischeri]|nr:hypothetical protein GB937_010176 [Aspergillus fischeri]
MQLSNHIKSHMPLEISKFPAVKYSSFLLDIKYGGKLPTAYELRKPIQSSQALCRVALINALNLEQRRQELELQKMEIELKK